MTLGVILHSSQVYNPEATWLLHSSLSSPVATFLVDCIHIFRLPSFFMVSGFFFLVSFRKYGESRFLRLRGERILVPLVVTAATINTIQAFMLDRSGWRPFVMSQYILEGKWSSHLWFLYYLFMFYLVGIVVMRTSTHIPPAITRGYAYLVEKSHVIILLCLVSLVQIFLLLLGKLLPIMYTPVGGGTLYNVVFYLQFFIFGVLLCQSKTLMYKFTNLSFLLSVPLLAMAVYLKLYLSQDVMIQLVLYKYFDILSIWLSSVICFSFFKSFADKPSKALAFLASSSYSVYLFHHILVIAFGLLFIRLGIGGLSGLVLLVLVVFSLSCLIHLLVTSSSILSYLFNGIKKKKELIAAVA